jgi:myo-inositol catabolism protein IolC
MFTVLLWRWHRSVRHDPLLEIICDEETLASSAAASRAVRSLYEAQLW